MNKAASCNSGCGKENKNSHFDQKNYSFDLFSI